MNELENFIIELNSIEKEKFSEPEEKFNKLAQYLFSSGDASKGGWTLLLALYEQKIEVNSIFGEKLNDLLVSNFVKLFSHLKLEPNTKVASDNAVFELDTTECQSGDLYSYLVICLTLWLRLNNSKHYLFTSSRILNNLVAVLFENDAANKIAIESRRIYQRLYLKFLDKLVQTSFKNIINDNGNNNKRVISVATKGHTEHLLIEQFEKIEKVVSTNERVLLLKIIVNYLSDYFTYVCVPGLIGASLNPIGFDNLMWLINEVCDFVFEELANSECLEQMCKKLKPILLEIKYFKNAYVFKDF